jgi:AcrR family transcriptional regulator
MSPRPDVSEERKTQILNAAETIFSEKGFDDARMDDIADKTGLSKATLYLYFQSKDALIIALLDRIFQHEVEQLGNQEHDTLGAADAIWKLTEMVTQDIVGMLRLIPIIYSFLALTFRNKYVQGVLKGYLNKYIDLFVPIIQRGIDSGEFRPVDAREVAIAANAIIEGTILLWVYDHSAIEPARHIRSGIRLLLEGVQAKP